MKNKFVHLRTLLKSMESVAVAFSGGVDSTFLLKVARDVLGDRVIAVTVRSEMFISTEYTEARVLSEQMNARLITVESKALDSPEVWQNPPDRCYHCKKLIFSKILDIAGKQGMAWVADGTHAGDMGDYRPGLRALEELGIRSPLKEAGLTKQEIRQFSKELGFPTYDKPSMACLASRFPYGVSITPEKLARVARAESFLCNLGFGQLRVRHHESLARIEVPPDSISGLADPEIRRKIVDALKKLGYHYITLDLQGYRTGSMNEILDRK